MISHKDYNFQIQFLDLNAFFAEGDLDTIARKFAPNNIENEKVK
jgi:hypothetical protein